MDLWVSSTMTLFVLLALAVCASCHIQIYDDTCWRKSVEAVERSCHTMGMEKQQQLALDSLNCHLQMSGREPYVCNGREFTQCLGAMDNTRFEMFAKFFSFVETTCQDQQIMSWQHTVWKASSLARATSVFQNRGLVFVLYLTGTLPQESWGTISADWSAIAV